jgi:hypothetical protein
MPTTSPFKIGRLGLCLLTVVLPAAHAGGIITVNRCNVLDGTQWIDCDATMPIGGSNGVPAYMLEYGATTGPACGGDSLASVTNPTAPTLGSCGVWLAAGAANATLPTPDPSYVQGLATAVKRAVPPIPFTYSDGCPNSFVVIVANVFYIDIRGTDGGVYVYQETNGIPLLQTGSPSPYVPADSDPCANDPTDPTDTHIY